MAAAPKTATKDTPPGNGKVKAGMPRYEGTKVEDLPEDLAPQTGTGNGRAYLYFNLMNSGPKQEPGEWFRIATFQTPTGAKDVAKDLTPNGEGVTKRPIPDGVWEISGRTIKDPDTDKLISALYVRYMGDE